MNILYILDLLGVIVFAISGAIVARDKQFDLFGGIVLAIVTAIGGGTFRDIALGRTPVFWLNDVNYFICAAGTAIVFLWLFRIHQFEQRWKSSLLIADAIGLAVFTIIGTQIALDADVNPAMSVAMGTITGCFGGVLRDVLANREPLIFQKEIYATASLAGGICYVLLNTVNSHEIINASVCIAVTFLMRVIAVYFDLQLPTYKQKNNANKL